MNFDRAVRLECFLTSRQFSAKLISGFSTKLIRKQKRKRALRMLRASVLAWLRLYRVAQKIDRAQSIHLRSWGLNTAQFDVLAHVGAHKGITQQELADSLLVTKGNISQLLDRMEKLGLLKRCQEKRNNTLELTEKGLELYDLVVPTT